VAAKLDRAALRLAVDHVSSVKSRNGCALALPKLKHACMSVTAAAPVEAAEAHRAARKCCLLCFVRGIYPIGAIESVDDIDERSKCLERCAVTLQCQVRNAKS
jgi:hypothetical protein